jgi:hypothetical protein
VKFTLLDPPQFLWRAEEGRKKKNKAKNPEMEAKMFPFELYNGKNENENIRRPAG